MKQAKVSPTMVETVDYFEPGCTPRFRATGSRHSRALRTEVHPVVIPLPKLPSSDLTGVTPVVAGFAAMGAVVLLATAAEVLHFRRVLRAAPLAFGPRRPGSCWPALRRYCACSHWGLSRGD